MEALIKDINRQKDAIKKTGIAVDGRCFKVKFTGYLCLPILTLYTFFYLIIIIFLQCFYVTCLAML